MNTVKIETKELTGRALDYAVCIALGWRRHVWDENDPLDYCWRAAPFDEEGIGVLIADNNFTPSTDWAHGGPLIEQFGIELNPGGGSWGAVVNPGGWQEYQLSFEEYGFSDRPLEAACKAIVLEKLGAGVEVPEDLLKPVDKSPAHFD